MPVAGWPVGDRTDRLVAWNGQLLALNHVGASSRLFAFDGETVRPLAMPASGRVRDLAADGRTLWAVVSDASRGSLWRTADGVVWEEIQRFDEPPIAVTAAAGNVFVGTYVLGGGSLWGSRTADMRKTAPAKPFGPPTIRRVPPASWTKLDATMAAYVEQQVGAHAGIEAVSDALRQLTTFEDPDIGRRLSERLAALDIKDRLGFFSRERVKRAHRLGWYLLGAIAVNGHGRIPPELLGVPLSTRQNDRRKNLDAPIAAIATVGWVAQDDRQTIEVLMERLRQVQGEPWLTSDVIAALTALTGQELGHDVERWQSWGEQQNRR
jgi:hypothetical protein